MLARLASLLLLAAAACGGAAPSPVHGAVGSARATSAPTPRATVDAPAEAPPADEHEHDAPDERATPTADPAAPLPPIEPTRLAVPGDRAGYVVLGDPKVPRAIVYLHGKCGDPLAFRAWARAAHDVGTVISLVGDVPCSGGRTRWSGDTRGLDQRIERAVQAASAALGAPLDAPRLVFGYSQGALRAEALAARYPDRYPLAVLAAGPRPPREGSLWRARGVVMLAGELDVRHPLAEAARELSERGRRARYVELEGARHGQYGPRAEPIVGEALAWLVAGEAPSLVASDPRP